MSEIELTDEQANALHGTTDADTGFRYHSPGDAGYFTEGQRQRHRLLTLAKAISNSLRVFADGPMTFGVRPGRARNGGSLHAHAGCGAVALTDDATNYVYLTAADLAAGDSVSVSTSGFPNQSATPHIPLAQIAVSDGSYGVGDITDCRGAAALTLGSSLASADANTLVGGSGSNADSLHVHSIAGLEASAKALVPMISLTAVDNSDGTATITAQMVDAEDNPIAAEHLVRIWTSNGELGEPIAVGTAFDQVPSYGAEIREIAAEADYEVISNSSGQVRRTLAVSADGTYWVTAAVGPHLGSTSVAITGT